MRPQALISRDYRGDVDLSSIDKFLPLVLDNEEEGATSPLVVHEKVTFVYIKHNNLYRILHFHPLSSIIELFCCVLYLNSNPVVATTIKNANIALIFSFLHKIVEVCKALVP